MSEMGQKLKNSCCANEVRFDPDSGHVSDVAEVRFVSDYGVVHCLAFAAAAFTTSIANLGSRLPRPSTLYFPSCAENRPVIASGCVGRGRAGIGVQQELGDQPT
jgi:hypothetical protein